MIKNQKNKDSALHLFQDLKVKRKNKGYHLI